MRDFNDADRKKKRNRIHLADNPGNLSEELLALLEQAVMTQIKEGYVTCPSAWRIARECNVSPLDAGAMTDRLGIRIIDCQIGCFKVNKTSSSRTEAENYTDGEVLHRIKALDEAGELTCKTVHDLSGELNIKPLTLADLVNMAGCKIKNCQLGCF